MFRFKDIYLFVLFFLFLQIAGYFFYRSGNFYLNDKFIFGLAGGNTVAITVSALFLIIIYFLIRNKNIFNSHSEPAVRRAKNSMIYYWLLLVGVFSNIIERIFYGGVIDYINLPIIPTFNLADLLIIFCLIRIFTKLISQKSI